MAKAAALTLSDKRHLEAAEGWLGLGNWLEAMKEIKALAVTKRSHPPVLRLRWGIYAAAKDWKRANAVAQIISKLVPDNSFGAIHWAYAQHEMGRTAFARDILLNVVTKFTKEWTIFYNLACYACQLGNFNEASAWLKQAIAIHPECRSMALEDKDLKPMRAEISRM